MKKFIFVSFFTLLLVFSSSAYSAEEGWYMRGTIGPALLNNADVTALSEADIEALIGEDLPAGTTYAVDLKFDTGFFINFAPGYDFGDFRLESEFAYQVNNVGKINQTLNIPGVHYESGSSYVNGGDVTNLSLLFNGYYDFLKGSAVRPYITAGIGVARVNAQIEGDDDTDSVFAYQVGVGLSYNMSENVALDFGYRYFATSDLDVFGLELSNSSYSILFGARYNF
jgi:opacity protein-like surface antigen